jgi:NADH-quinone oxidoreductase subunit L
MTGVYDLLWLIPVLPLLGAFVLGVVGKRLSQPAVSAIGVGSVFLSFLVSAGAAWAYWASESSQPVLRSYFTWLEAGSFRIEASFHLDALSVVMILVVSGVGFLIHVYSTGYMAHEGGYYRFFAYLNLFMFFMLTLVLAGNYALLFVGWEGVGLCSYLLIGFYFLRDSASNAGKKAFIVNRIGDFGFTLALLLMFWTFGSLDYATVFERAAALPVESATWSQAGVVTAIALLLFAGATGKSAQLPLYVWLPDAMEGPTPVSALIHAATMVAAGVYMVARSHVLFTHAPFALMVVAVIGGLTAFYAATIGLVQNDIKRVLAYSTVSQLGYMFLACGVGAFVAAIFHLMTHAFFKALLFLGSGSVIHALGGEQDVRKMGALYGKIRTTALTFWFGTLAIAGAPLFSGFFSKDEILWQAYASPYGHVALWALGASAAALTSFYMFRLVFVTFYGEPRYTHEVAHHIHESPASMTVPLVILAVLSLVGGWVGIPVVLGEPLHIPNLFEHFLAPVFASSTVLLEGQAAEHAHNTELALMGLAIGLALAGFVLAYAFYVQKPERAEALAARFRGAYQVLLNKYYVDELYAALFVRPTVWLSERVLWRAFDVAVVDGAVNGTATRARGLGGWVRQWQSGNTRSYGAWVVAGVLVVLTMFAFR